MKIPGIRAVIYIVVPTVHPLLFKTLREIRLPTLNPFLNHRLYWAMLVAGHPQKYQRVF